MQLTYERIKRCIQHQKLNGLRTVEVTMEEINSRWFARLWRYTYTGSAWLCLLTLIVLRYSSDSIVRKLIEIVTIQSLFESRHVADKEQKGDPSRSSISKEQER